VNFKNINFFFQAGTLILIIVACAKLGAPTGGPKDVDPPEVKKAKPANYSVNYNRRKIIIGFDEYIKLDDVFTEFTISPPVEKRPLPRSKGKAILVELPYSKLDSATYTLDFGQSVKDNNEGNLFKNFQFVVSTQPFIDSFSVRGKVLDAFNHKADEKSIAVYIRKNLADTAPFKVIPSYLGRTDPKGNYRINHVSPGTYSIMALKDLNNNMLFDLPDEIIAFSNQLIYLNIDSVKNKIPKVDTSKVSAKAKQKEQNKPDKAVSSETHKKNNPVDSVAIYDSIKLMTYGYEVNLFSFKETGNNQYLVDYSRKVPENFKLIFNEPLEKKLPIRLLNLPMQDKWYYLETDKTPDTLVYWLADSSLVKTDSLVVELTYPFTDTIGKLISKTDTLLLRSTVIEKTDSKSENKKTGLGRLARKDKKEEADTMPNKIPRLPFETNINKSAHDLNAPVLITTNAPVFNFDNKLYKLYKYNDTIPVPIKSTFIKDTSNFRRFKLNIDFEPYTRYKLDLFEGFLTDIYGRTIDSTSYSFTTQRDDYYGSILLNFNGVKGSILVQLLGKDEVVLSQKIIHKSQQVTFDYLKPGKYRLKIISDDNNNGKWDTGNLKEKLQPEKVDYYPKEIDMRSNWEVEYTWEVKW
jgi:uncharacterized protein (DUF2141 family)